jgi:hypothetical protein
MSQIDKYTVSYLRNKYCNYENKTLNERRYDKIGRLHDVEYYPLGDVYPNLYNKNLLKLPRVFVEENKEVDEKWFLDYLTYQRIHYSIIYLQPEALKKHLVKNYKNILLGNPFLLFTTANMAYSIDKNADSVIEIINILVKNYDNYEELIEDIPNENTEYIKSMIYDQIPDSNETPCYICLESRPFKRLIYPCDCKNPIHVECLLQLEKHKRLDKCSICTAKYKINEPVWNTNSGIIIKEAKIETFFPHNDFYPIPLSSSRSLHKVTGMDRLDFAIMYLQVDRVKELLQSEDILLELKDHYLGYKGYKQTPLIALSTGNIGDNCNINFGNNHIAYIRIISMLLKTKKIDIDAVDAFGKSAEKYIEENRFMFLKQLLNSFRSNIDRIIYKIELSS